ncbi:MAG: signal peptidase II [Opitutales bacterium]|nr:signal peptidase II [Opitutales bacterium]
MISANNESNLPAKRRVEPFPRVFFAAACLVALLDQITKWAVARALPWVDNTPVYNLNSASAKPVEVVKDFFYIVHITNEGAAWGMLSGQTYLLSSIALVTLSAMWIFRRELGFKNPVLQVAMGLFGGGIVGNLLDRIFRGQVVDFLDVHLPFVNYRWPAFNVADCAIAAGVTLYIIVSMLMDFRQKAEVKSGMQKLQDGVDGK